MLPTADGARIFNYVLAIIILVVCKVIIFFKYLDVRYIFPSFCISLFLYMIGILFMSVHLYICPSICLSISRLYFRCMSIHCLSVWCLSIFLSVHPLSVLLVSVHPMSVNEITPSPSEIYFSECWEQTWQLLNYLLASTLSVGKQKWILRMSWHII